MTSIHDEIWEEALQEAYASAPTEEVILHTLELRHSSFDETAIRVVMDYGDLFTVNDVETRGHYLTLEPTAPVQASQSVLFQSCMFRLSLPEQKEGSLPSIDVELDNVTREISQYLDEAIGDRAPLELTYREYLASNKIEPQFILGGLTMRQVKANMSRVTGTAQFGDLINKSFPGKLYRPDEFRGLSQ